jgi:phosphoglycolate phosphatase-like HAD superfamily hydrolase
MSRFASVEIHIFDCDGVILDSNGIKGEVFHDVARMISPAHADDLLAFHREHGGLNRRRKFEHFFNEILGRGPTPEEFARALDLFRELNLKKMKAATLIPGVEDYLTSLPPRSRKFVVSAGDHDDLVEILNEKGLLIHFESVWGGPEQKIDIIDRLQLRGPAVFYGDSEVDYKTAAHFGFDFVFVSGHCSWTDWERRLAGLAVTVVADFRDLASHR